MSTLKEESINILNNINQENRINHNEYSILYDAINEIETIEERDELLEKMWAEFGDVPFNPETEQIEVDFGPWKAGTDKEDIWHWFDERYSKGVYELIWK